MAKHESEKGQMTVQEAGKLGGKKGGEKVARERGHEFYEEIGHKGGQRVRELVEEGKRSEKPNE
jgi:general stress protein YciG